MISSARRQGQWLTGWTTSYIGFGQLCCCLKCCYAIQMPVPSSSCCCLKKNQNAPRPSCCCCILHINRSGLNHVFFCVFFPFILDIKFVGRTSRGHTGGRSHRIFNPPSFCGACLDFCREKDSAIPFPRRP